MGVITIANLKVYQCATWAEGDTHGGDIDTGSEITTGVDENIFDDVEDAERVAGDTEYRKIYFRNENSETWEAVKSWIEANTPASNDAVSIKLGTNAGVKSVEGVAAGYVSPDAKDHADVLEPGDQAENAYFSVWIKRIVAAAGDGYTDNTFEIAAESS